MNIFLCNGEFDDDMVKLFYEFVRDLNPLTKEAAIFIDSPGGDVAALNSIVSIMGSTGIHWHTVAISDAISCGLLLLAAGDTRHATERARLMFHKEDGVKQGSAEMIISAVEATKPFMEATFNMFYKKTKKAEKWWSNKIKKTGEYWIGPDEALKIGVIDKIGTVAF